jgi:hypothetical protein
MTVLAVAIAAIGLVLWIAGARFVMEGQRLYAALSEAGALVPDRDQTVPLWQHVVLGKKADGFPSRFNALAAKSFYLVTGGTGCFVLAWWLAGSPDL